MILITIYMKEIVQITEPIEMEKEE
jgi:hypothetical protein